MKFVKILFLALALLIVTNKLVEHTTLIDASTNTSVKNPPMKKYSYDTYDHYVVHTSNTGPKRICGGLFCCSL